MGNTHSLESLPLQRQWHSTQSEFSYASSSYSGFSLASSQRSWIRKSKRRYHNATINTTLRYKESKTLWPTPYVETIFLPEFPIKGQVNESHFRIVSQLARGAFGSVLKVCHKTSGSFYAMKVLHKSRVIMENAIQQCKDEVTIQSVLGHHTFILRCDFYWQNRKELFIATSFLEGGELLTLWKEHKTFSENFVRIVTAEIAVALDFLHNAGVIYRDLKMENILLDSEGHVQLIDFGLSKWLSVGMRTSTICGTIQYMAPEILSMDVYGHAADWWSLGIIMYSLLVGHFPVQTAEDHRQMQSLVASASYQLPETCSNSASIVIRKLLCKVPKRRLHNLYSFKFEPFFRHLNFDQVLERKISPREILSCDLKTAEKCEVMDNTEDGCFEGFSWNGIEGHS